MKRRWVGLSSMLTTQNADVLEMARFYMALVLNFDQAEV